MQPLAAGMEMHSMTSTFASAAFLTLVGALVVVLGLLVGWWEQRVRRV